MEDVYFDVYKEINDELAKMDPKKFMPLIEGHSMRTMMFPVTIDEAKAMHR